MYNTTWHTSTVRTFINIVPFINKTKKSGTFYPI